MEIIVFEKEAYWKLHSELFRMFRETMKELQQPPDDWISTEEAKALLSVKSKSHMQHLRDTNAIKFSKHGKKLIKYSRASILEHLNRHIPKY